MANREARCPHHFLRSVVKCPTCDGGARAAPVKETAPATTPLLEVGMLCAGVKLLELMSIEQRPCARALCECGNKFTIRTDNLRRIAREGKVARCPLCPRAMASVPETAKPAPKISPTPALRAEPSAAPAAAEATPGTRRWWRLELDAKGAVKSCTAVEQRGADGEVQFIYVLAFDQAEAGRRAWNEYTKLRERAKRARMIREWKCPWCCKTQDRAPGKRCTTCLAKEREREVNERKLARGEAAPLASHASTRAERLISERAGQRLEVLREVHEAAKRMNPSDFFEWLNEQLGLKVRNVG